MHQIILTTKGKNEDPYSVITLKVDDKELHQTGGYKDPYSALLEMANWLVHAYQEAKADNICDVCLGAGEPLSKKPCMCRGTGKMSEAAIYLREQLVEAEMELDKFAVFVAATCNTTPEVARKLVLE